jgi:hypothetical protein
MHIFGISEQFVTRKSTMLRFRPQNRKTTTKGLRISRKMKITPAYCIKNSNEVHFQEATVADPLEHPTLNFHKCLFGPGIAVQCIFIFTLTLENFQKLHLHNALCKIKIGVLKKHCAVF